MPASVVRVLACCQRRMMFSKLLLLFLCTVFCTAAYFLSLHAAKAVRSSALESPPLAHQHIARANMLKSKPGLSKMVTLYPAQIGLRPKAGLIQSLYSYTSRRFEEQRLYVCPILKNAHSGLNNLFCDYTVDKGYVARKGTEHYLNDLDECWKSYLSHPEHRRVQPLPVLDDWHKMAIIRDPIDRLLSGYTMFCTKKRTVEWGGPWACYQCELLDIDCFIRRNYARMVMKSQKEFANDTGFMLDWHFIPQSWYCSFLERPQTFELIFHTHADDFGASMRQWAYDRGLRNASKNARFYSGLPKYATVNVTDAAIVLRRLYSNPELMDIFYKTYEVDYAMFNFTLPRPFVKPCERRKYHKMWSFCKRSS